MTEPVLALEDIGKTFRAVTRDGKDLEILRSVSFSLERGESLSIVGRSGSGKSTLLYIASLIEKPTSGRVLYSGVDTSSLGERQSAALRREKMGFVFQNSLLLEDFSALENVMIPLLNCGVRKAEAKKRSEEILERIGLEKRLDHRPFELSGGERQRVAIARAIVTRPEIVFADEPTGALDEESQSLVEDMLFSLVRDEGIALLLVTHNSAFASKSDRTMTLVHRGLVG